MLGMQGGTLYDWSGNHMHGTLTNMDLNADWVVTGWPAVSLAGTNQYVNLGNSSLNPNADDFTIDLFAKFPDVNAASPILTKRQSTSPFAQISLYQGTANASGTITASKKISFFFIQDGSNSKWGHTTNDVVNGEWHDIAVRIYDGDGSWDLVIDGKTAAKTMTRSLGSPSVSNSATWQIGRDNASSYGAFTLGSCSLFRKALTDSELAKRRLALYEVRDRSAVADAVAAGGMPMLAMNQYRNAGAL